VNTAIHQQPAEQLASPTSELRRTAWYAMPASSRAIGLPPNPKLGPSTSYPDVGPTATGSPSAIPREHLSQRIGPRMMIGVILVLEVAWIVFLVYWLILLVRFAFQKW
jgi:hypothetical protein